MANEIERLSRISPVGWCVSDWPTDQVFGYIAGAAKSFLKTYKRFLSSDRHHIQSERRMFV